MLQELSKITMPVIFNEPLSFLQRVVEYMEYERLLERACASDDPIERHEVGCHLSCNQLCCSIVVVIDTDSIGVIGAIAPTAKKLWGR